MSKVSVGVQNNCAEMSSVNSDCGPSLVLSLVAQCDDLNRLNNVLNDGAAEDCE